MNSRKVMTEALQAAQNCSPRLTDVCRNEVQVSIDVASFQHLVKDHELVELIVWSSLLEEIPSYFLNLSNQIASMTDAWQRALHYELKSVRIIGAFFDEAECQHDWDEETRTLEVTFIASDMGSVAWEPIDLDNEPTFEVAKFKYGVVVGYEEMIANEWGLAIDLAIDFASFDRDESGGMSAFRIMIEDDGERSIRPIYEAFHYIWKHEWDEDMLRFFAAFPQRIVYGHTPGDNERNKRCEVKDATIKLYAVHNAIHDKGLFDVMELVALLLHEVIQYQAAENPQVTSKLLRIASLRREVYEKGISDEIVELVNKPPHYMPIDIEKEALEMCKARIPADERYVKGWHVAKINRKGMEQERMIILTNQSFITMGYDFHAKKIDKGAGKTHRLSELMCIDIGKFEDDPVNSPVVCSVWFTEKRDHGRPPKRAKKKGKGGAEEEKNALAVVDERSVFMHTRAPEASETIFHQRLRERPPPPPRYHPPTEGVYQNLLVPWNKQTERESFELFYEVAWTVYALASAYKCSGIGWYPYTGILLARPKQTAAAKLYNATKKGYSSSKLVRRTSQQAPPSGRTASHDGEQPQPQEEHEELPPVEEESASPVIGEEDDHHGHEEFGEEECVDDVEREEREIDGIQQEQTEDVSDEDAIPGESVQDASIHEKEESVQESSRKPDE